MDKVINLHIVDDERPIVMTLEKVISKVFPSIKLHLHYDGLTAWKSIQEIKETSIIISDLNMPGLTGLQLLKKIRSEQDYKDFYFLVITSSVDPEINIKTIQQGADDFLTKPFSVDQLIVKIRAALRVVNLIHESNKLKDTIAELKVDMEKDAEAMIDHIKTFQAIRMPELVKKLPRIVEAAEWIAFQLAETEKEVKNIKRAAEICFCGKLYLNEKLVEQPVMVKGLTPYKIMSDVPNFSRDLLKPIRNTVEVDKILYYIYENLDGSGFPEKKKSWEIPLGSRILRVAIEFEELLKKNFDNPGKTIEAMLVEAKRLYDHRVLAFYDQFLGSKEVSRELGVKGREFTVRIHELDENMMTARHIITESGLILVAPNIGLNEERIERIRMINKTDNIIGKIYIRNK